MVATGVISVSQGSAPNGFAPSWGVDELTLPAIDSHVGNVPGATGGKEDQIAGLQSIPGHRLTGTELIP